MGMVIGAVLAREDPRDAVLLHPRHQGSSLGKLPAGAVIGGSLRLSGVVIGWLEGWQGCIRWVVKLSGVVIGW